MHLRTQKQRLISNVSTCHLRLLTELNKVNHLSDIIKSDADYANIRKWVLIREGNNKAAMVWNRFALKPNQYLNEDQEMVIISDDGTMIYEFDDDEWDYVYDDNFDDQFWMCSDDE